MQGTTTTLYFIITSLRHYARMRLIRNDSFTESTINFQFLSVTLAMAFL